MGGKRRGSKDVKDSEERGDWREEKGIKDARDSAGKRWEVRSRSKHERVGLERDGRYTCCVIRCFICDSPRRRVIPL